MFANQSIEDAGASTADAHESKQNFLIDLSTQQMKNKNGTDWTIMFNFYIHFIELQQIDYECDVEIESTTSTSRTSTPMETEEEDYSDKDSEDDDDEIGSSTSRGECNLNVANKQKFHCIVGN